MKSPVIQPRLASVLCLSAGLLSAPVLMGQVPRDMAVDLSAAVSTNTPCITLSWTQRMQANITAQKVYRRLKGTSAWTQTNTLTVTQTSYADSTAVPGVEYEYWMARTFTGIYPSPAMGYISAGLNVPVVEARGKLLLVIDDTMLAPLASEIEQLKKDLAGDGWTVQPITAQRTATAASVKALLQTAYNADPANIKMVYLLGHVPVPYSGNMAPDGHGNHVGAWPADGYYGEMNGTWTDATVNRTDASDVRNRNSPGDGKFDQSNFPNAVELMVGRVDLHSMARAPSPSVPEVTLLRRYLRKAHDFRHKQGAYAAIPRQSLIRDGFGAFGSEHFAIAGWSWAFTSVGQMIDEAPSMQWFSPTYAGGKTYLVGYGNGGGSWEYAGSVGNTSDFGRRPSGAVFTSLFGSYFGDWDCANALMRSVLAGTATGDSLGLTCFWGGRPNRVMHHMGMGETAAYGMRASQNSQLAGGGGYTPYCDAQVHSGLLGDPALRLHVVEPPRNLAASSDNAQVTLAWTASTETNLLGYTVYRADTATGPFTRLTASPLALTSYTDATVTPGQSYSYLVRTLKLETAPGGTYQNLSVGSMATLLAKAAATGIPRNPSGLTITQTNAVSALLTWTDNAADETGYRIERKINAGGSFAPLGTVAADANHFLDTGIFAPGSVYYYRVIATGVAGDSAPSSEVSFDADAGFFDVSTTLLKASKAAGSATLTVNRFGGKTGAASVRYTTSDSSAVAGTHYTATSGTLTWNDGETGSKTVAVPLLATALPQPGRQFRFTLSNPSSGTALGVYSSMAVLIEDPAGTLPAPWSQATLGTVTAFSPTVLTDGVLGTATVGGGGAVSGSNSDNGRFIYQSRTGDGVMTAYFPAGSPAHYAARYAVMVRETLGNNVLMASAMTSADSGFGSKLTTRTARTGNASASPSAANALRLPCWLRLSRAGQVFTAEHSADGSAWTLLGTSTHTYMPETALWGIFSYSANWADSSTYEGDYYLARAQSVSLSDLPPPVTPAGLAATVASSTSISLQWNSASFASGYRIERRNESGGFAVVASVASSDLATQSFTDTGLAVNTAYGYRVIATHANVESLPSDTAYASTPADTMLVLTTDSAGGADATVRRDLPEIALGTQTNLMVAGYDPDTWSVRSDAAKTYLRFDLTGVGAFTSAKLNLAFVGESRFADVGYYMPYLALLAESSDTWVENTITWSNAPQNNLSGVGFTGSFTGVGYNEYFEVLPSPGEVVTFELSAAYLSSNRGANNQITLGLAHYDGGAVIEWASREHPTFAAPTLELIIASSLPNRASFLTAGPGSGWSIALNWKDNSTNETGFVIERREGAGAFAVLQSIGANAVSFSDATTQAGITYTYRIRPFNASGDAEWTPEATFTAATVENAVSTVWDGGGADTLIDTLLNWDFNTRPAFDGSETLCFGAGGTTATINTPVSLRGIVLNRDADFTLAGGDGSLTLGAGGIVVALPGTTSRNYTLTEDLALSALQAWGITNNGAGVATLTVSGGISDGASTFGLAKSGNGVLILAGNNSYDGVTTVRTGGVLRVTHANALGSTLAATSIENGGWLEVSGGIAVAEPLTLNGDVALGYAGTLRNTGGSNVWSGPVTLNGARIRVTGGSLDVVGGISGGGALCADSGKSLRISTAPINFGTGGLYAHSGGGMLILNVSGNSWGVLDLGGGSVRTDVANALPPTSTLQLNPGTSVDLNGNSQTVGQFKNASATAGARTVTSATPATLTVDQSATTFFDGVLTGALGLTKAGTGTLTLSNALNTLSGIITVQGGTLIIAPASCLGSSTNIVVQSGTLALQTQTAIADNATLAILNGGKVMIGTNLTETVDRLLLDNMLMGCGTYGSSTSGAEHVDDTHFEGSGRINVLSSFPAAITLPPAVVTVAPGESAEFSVTATGSDPLFYQWHRNGMDIPGATGSAYTTPATVFEDNGARFSVTVSNALGTATSEDVVLTVFDATRHSLPYREPFERFTPDFLLAGFEGWRGVDTAARISADTALLERLHAYGQPIGFPLRHEAHTLVALISSAITNRLTAPSNTAVWCDMMVDLAREAGQPPAVPADMQCALFLDDTGHLNVWHRDLAGVSNHWTTLAWQTAQTAQWARVTLHLDYATLDTAHNARYFRLFVDGAAQSSTLAYTLNDGSGVPGGTWFALTAAPDRINSLFFDGNGTLDDLTVDTLRPLIGLGPHGTPEWWLADNGLTNALSLALNELADDDRDGFLNWKEYAAGTSPTNDASLLRFTNMPVEANGRFGLVIQTMPGRRYTLEGSSTLEPNSWEAAAFALTSEGTPSQQTITATAETMTFYVEADGPLHFFRVQVDVAP